MSDTDDKAPEKAAEKTPEKTPEKKAPTSVTSADRPVQGSRKLRTFANAMTFTLAIAGVLIAANVVASTVKTRPWDMTEEHMHSLSPAAKELIRQLPEPVKIKAYISSSHPEEYKEFVRYLSILLDQYESVGSVETEVIRDGQPRKVRVPLVTWSKMDPDKLPKSREQMKEDWLKQRSKELGKTIDEVRAMDASGDAALGKDPNQGKEVLTQADLREQGIKKGRFMVASGNSYKEMWFYLMLQIEYRGERQVIAFNGPRTEGLEYQFTSLLKRLAFGKKKLGITTAFGEAPEQQTQGIRGALQDTIELTTVAMNGDKVAEELSPLDGLIVAGPRQKMSEAALRAIDTFIMKGKPVLFLVDGLTFQGANQMDAQIGRDTPYLGQANDHGLDTLLEAYGFKVNKDVIVDLKHNTLGFVVNGREIFEARAFFPSFPKIANGKGGVLPGINLLTLPFVSSVENLEGKRVKTEKLITLAKSSGAAFTAGSELVIISPGMTLDPKKGKVGPFSVGFAAVGTFKSAFAPAAPADGAMSAPPVTGTESPPNTRVAVFGDSDMISDLYLMMAQQLPTDDLMSGIRSVHNVAEWLLEDQALSRIRNKGTPRPLDVVSEGKQSAIKFGNIFGPPVVLVIFGVVMWQLRRARRRNLSL